LLADQPDLSFGAIFGSVWNGMLDVFVRLRFLSLVGLLISCGGDSGISCARYR